MSADQKKPLDLSEFKGHTPPIMVPVRFENSEVDGGDWSLERFNALDFSADLFTDKGYPQGCIKYVPCSLDGDPTCGHRVRSRFAKATPIKWECEWYWLTSANNEPTTAPDLLRELALVREQLRIIKARVDEVWENNENDRADFVDVRFLRPIIDKLLAGDSPTEGK